MKCFDRFCFFHFVKKNYIELSLLQFLDFPDQQSIITILLRTISYNGRFFAVELIFHLSDLEKIQITHFFFKSLLILVSSNYFLKSKAISTSFSNY